MKKWLPYFLPALALILILTACTPAIPDGGTHPSSTVTSPSQTETTIQNETTVPTEPTVQTTVPTAPTEQTVPPTTQPAQTQPPQTEPPVTEPPAPTAHSCPDADPYVGISKEQFYADYTVACCRKNALFRSKHGFLSGSLEVPGQYAVDAAYRPMKGNSYIRNADSLYLDDGNTYVVVDGYGNEVMRIYRGGGYITLEEVAAYMYAFGGSSDDLPANYTSKKKPSPSTSIWGEYLRANHSSFKGNTDKYPYEPELPDISGCGGDLSYYEMDIGTTGTVTPGHTGRLYNNGSSITRGAARLVYARQDLNGNGVYENNEIYVFYTHNHYNDFREYLNYYGGWGEMFGNVTGGGTFDSKTNYKPTPYVPTVNYPLAQWEEAA